VSLRGRLAARTGLSVIVDKDTKHRRVRPPVARRPAAVTTALCWWDRYRVGLLVDGSSNRGPRTNAGEFGAHHVVLEARGASAAARGCVK